MKRIIPYLGIALGSLIFAGGLNYFIIANGLAEGGFTGLALVIHYLTNWSVGIILLVLNIPLFFIGGYFWGKEFFFKTLLGVLAVSLAIDLTANWGFQTNDLLLGALYGGTLTGIGIGLVLRSGATTGGVDILARLIHEKTGINIGSVYFGFDLALIFLVVIFFGLEIALYTLVALFIFSRVIDRFLEGGHEARAVTVISTANQEIKKAILHELERGATLFKGIGAYTGEEKNILYVIINKQQLLPIKKIIYEIDPQAFVIVSNVFEVIGEGFQPQK